LNFLTLLLVVNLCRKYDAAAVIYCNIEKHDDNASGTFMKKPDYYRWYDMEIPDAAASGTISKKLMLLPEVLFRKTDAASGTT
jgi:hypothetical protein